MISVDPVFSIYSNLEMNICQRTNKSDGRYSILKHVGEEKDNARNYVNKQEERHC